MRLYKQWEESKNQHSAGGPSQAQAQRQIPHRGSPPRSRTQPHRQMPSRNATDLTAFSQGQEDMKKWLEEISARLNALQTMYAF
jgi:hypothetical protein